MGGLRTLMRHLPVAANDCETTPASKRRDQASSLVTYRYFACSSSSIDRSHSVGSLPIREQLQTSGGLRLAPIAVSMLEAAGNTLGRLCGHRLTQVDVNLFEAGHGVSQVKVENHLLREGRTQAFTEAALLQSPQGRLLGHGGASWAVSSTGQSDFSLGEGPVAGHGIGSEEKAEILEAFGGKRVGVGALIIDKLTRRIGTRMLHYGPILALLEEASLDIAISVGGAADIRPQVLNCRIVRPAREGPFLFQAEVYNHSGDLLACRATIVEEGNPETPVAVMQWQARLL